MPSLEKQIAVHVILLFFKGKQEKKNIRIYFLYTR